MGMFVRLADDFGGAVSSFQKSFFRNLVAVLVAGALFAFMLSFDDFVITFFVKGAGDTTLPVYIQSAIRHGKNTAVLNALSVVFLILTFIIVFSAQKLLTMKTEEHK